MLPAMEHSPLGSACGDPSMLPIDATLAVAIRAHAASDRNQLGLNLHDRVVVLERDESGWWGGHRLGEEFAGWFPGACVMEIRDQQIDQFHDQPVHDQQVQDQQNDLMQYAGWEEERPSRGRLSSTFDTSNSSHNSKRLSAATSPQHPVSNGPDRRSLRPTVIAQNDTATQAALRAAEAKAAQMFDELTRLQRQREAEKREADAKHDEFLRMKHAIERSAHEKTSEVEYHLHAERAEKQRLLLETETLRNHLEREKRKCQAQKEEMERCRDAYSRQLKEKDELIQSSRKSSRLAEERARVLKEELQAMTSQRSIDVSEVFGSADQKPVRRLFSSTGSNEGHDQSAGERSSSPPSGLPVTATQTASSGAAERPQAPVNTDTPRAATGPSSTHGVVRTAPQTQVSNTNHPISSSPPPLLPTPSGGNSGTPSGTQFGTDHQARTRISSNIMLPAAAVGRAESQDVSRCRGRQGEEVMTPSQLQQKRRAGSQGPATMIGSGDERPSSGSVANKIRDFEKRAGTPQRVSREGSSTSLDSPATLRPQVVSDPPPYAMSFAADQRDSQPPVASRSQQHSNSGRIAQAPVRGESPRRDHPNSSRTCLTSAFMSAPVGGSIPVVPGSQEGRKMAVKPPPLVVDDISRQDSSLVSPAEEGENTPVSVRDRVRFFARK
eukprot:TRINITY_DN2700_c0_g1_i1.p1 TRINITY_DN2700_c0_g1~~TRINITY_DN2700_c0_g1_i1.p1  ORF type:complete len:667 (+),score=88.43 TRINITY_DN2700_c0_g1_i1:56-2056(+)